MVAIMILIATIFFRYPYFGSDKVLTFIPPFDKLLVAIRCSSFCEWYEAAYEPRTDRARS